MATISLAATSLTARSKTISAGDTTRLLNAYRIIYGKKPDGSDYSNQEIFDIFADGVFNYVREQVRNVERDTAAKAVTDVGLS